MKITRKQLRQIIKEAINEYRGSPYVSQRRGGHGPMTVRDIERMLPPGVMREYPGAANVLQRRALAAKMSKNDLEDKIKAARIKDNEHPRQFFKRLGFQY